MLTSNLWVDVGLVNGAMGTIQAICYRTGGPPDLPITVMVHFDSYSGPTFHDSTVPITPLRRCWSSAARQCSRLQLPLKLAWAVTIHKSQGLTLDKVVIKVVKRVFNRPHICCMLSCSSTPGPSLYSSVPISTSRKPC